MTLLVTCLFLFSLSAVVISLILVKQPASNPKSHGEAVFLQSVGGAPSYHHGTAVFMVHFSKPMHLHET